MLSEWSFQMFNGADNALFATAMTIGSLMPAAINTISCIRAIPCDAVAVKVLTPVACAPMHADIAECSDSVSIISASIAPLFMKSAILSTIWVCGVIGYIATTAGLQSFTASATAWLASITCFAIYFFTSRILSF